MFICYSFLFLSLFPLISPLTLLVASPLENSQTLTNSTYFSEVELNLLIAGLTNLSIYPTIIRLNSTKINDFLPEIINKTDIVALGGFPITEENLNKGLIFSVPTETHYFVALSYNAGSMSFSSFLSYFVSDSVFFVFIFLIFFGGLFIYFAEKKANMAFKKELLVGLALGMWQIYQYFYKRLNDNIKSITGRILTGVVIFFFSWLSLYLVCYLIVNHYNVILQKNQTNTEFFEFPMIYTKLAYKEYIANYQSVITTYDDSTSASQIVNFMQQNTNHVLVTDSITVNEIFRVSCNFQVESTNFRLFNTGAFMDVNNNSNTLKLINRAIISAKQSLDFINNYTQSIYYENNCGKTFFSFFSTISETSSIDYTNLLDVIISVVSGIAMSIIALIFSRKALFYFQKKKKVKKLLKELNSNENRLFEANGDFFCETKGKNSACFG